MLNSKPKRVEKNCIIFNNLRVSSQFRLAIIGIKRGTKRAYFITTESRVHK